MTAFRKTAVLASLLLFGAAGCADLVVTNEDAPDRERALATAGDVEALIAGGYQSWFVGEQQAGSTAGSPGLFLAAAAFQWSSTAGNFAVNEYSKIPRVPITNSSTHDQYGFFSTAWARNYSAIAAANLGLQSLRDRPSVVAEMTPAELLRARIFARLVQGIAHANLAVLYDRAYVVSEDTAIVDNAGVSVLLGEPAPYATVMNSALGFLTEAATLASGSGASGVTFPKTWMSTTNDVTAAQMVRLINSFKARYRVSVARTPQERNAVNWTAVLAETGAGLKTDFINDQAYAFSNWVGYGILNYPESSTFGQTTLFINGMADTSGNYQKWVNTPLASRDRNFGTDPILIHTPDNRFPKGSTINEQRADSLKPTLHYRTAWSGRTTAANRPERGVWRRSYYWNKQLDGGRFATTWPLFRAAEIRLTAAEALFRTGNLQGAADSINVSRVEAGLNPANAAGVNTSCVPKLPNGSCGNLFEQLKWEKRQETFMTGPYYAMWYFDSRGWGDLYRGTPLQFPIPDLQLQLLQIGDKYTFGGEGPGSAPLSNYAYPGE